MLRRRDVKAYLNAIAKEIYGKNYNSLSNREAEYVRKIAIKNLYKKRRR